MGAHLVSTTYHDLLSNYLLPRQVNVMQIVYVARHLFPRWEAAKAKGAFCVTGVCLALISSNGLFVMGLTQATRIGIKLTHTQTHTHAHTSASAAGLLMQIGSLPYTVNSRFHLHIYQSSILRLLESRDSMQL